MFNNILLPLDLENHDGESKAMRTAIEMARTFDAKLHVLTVVPSYGSGLVGSFFPEGFEKQAQNLAGERLAQLVKTEFPEGVDASAHVLVGSIYEKIIDAAAKLECDAIIMGAHRPELRDYLLGPNAARVVRHAKQSVFVVRD